MRGPGPRGRPGRGNVQAVTVTTTESRYLMGQLSFLYALSAVGFTAPESGMQRHTRAYMTKYVRLPAHFCTLKNLNGPSRWPGQLEYTRGLIEVNTREDSLNRGLIEVLSHRPATGT